MGNACLNRRVSSGSASEIKNHGRESHSKSKENNDEYTEFLASSWPGSVLKWSEDELKKFANCFHPHFVKLGEEVCMTDNYLYLYSLNN